MRACRGLQIELTNGPEDDAKTQGSKGAKLIHLFEGSQNHAATNINCPCFPSPTLAKPSSGGKYAIRIRRIPFPKTAPHAFGILVRDSIEIMLQRVEGYRKPGALQAAQ